MISALTPMALPPPARGFIRLVLLGAASSLMSVFTAGGLRLRSTPRRPTGRGVRTGRSAATSPAGTVASRPAGSPSRTGAPACGPPSTARSAGRGTGRGSARPGVGRGRARPPATGGPRGYAGRSGRTRRRNRAPAGGPPRGAGGDVPRQEGVERVLREHAERADGEPGVLLELPEIEHVLADRHTNTWREAAPRT